MPLRHVERSGRTYVVVENGTPILPKPGLAPYYEFLKPGELEHKLKLIGEPYNKRLYETNWGSKRTAIHIKSKGVTIIYDKYGNYISSVTEDDF